MDTGPLLGVDRGPKVLEKLVRASVKEIKAKYESTAKAEKSAKKKSAKKKAAKKKSAKKKASRKR